MMKGTITLWIPHPHQGDIAENLLMRILKQARISRAEWEDLLRSPLHHLDLGIKPDAINVGGLNIFGEWCSEKRTKVGTGFITSARPDHLLAPEDIPSGHNDGTSGGRVWRT